MKFNELSNKIPVSCLAPSSYASARAAGTRTKKELPKICRSRERVLETNIWLLQENYF